MAVLHINIWLNTIFIRAVAKKKTRQILILVSGISDAVIFATDSSLVDQNIPLWETFHLSKTFRTKGYRLTLLLT